MRIAVTGAGGFIGGAVATTLADLDHEVVGFGRRPDAWAHPHARYRVWDLTTGPVRADRGFEAVVHCAALADDWAPREEAMRVNRDGTRMVARSFPHARIVHISTSSVYDAFEPSVDISEDAAPVRRHVSAYSESKTLAEFELAGTDAVILRPHAVYGPGDTTLLPRILAGVRRGRLVLPEGAEVRHSLTSIGNLVLAVRRGLDPGSPRGTYNIADDVPVLLSVVLREFLERRGVRARLVPIPYRAAFALAGTLETAARATRTRPRLTRYAVSQLGMERTLDLTRARSLLGYRPAPTSLEGAETW
ncbi:MAG TPA: NAD-dependent epimerase/dehydratase family protein [Pseudolysinimonas sp.]|nr:NAD-dependent epimerase/dehydratase family protein [Pseudolysinimonas sp.]